MTRRILLAAAIVCSLAGSAMAEKEHPLNLWSGVISADAVKQLSNPVKTKVKGDAFTSAVITDKKSLAKFVKAAGKSFPQDSKAKFSFEKYALIVVMLEKHTNALKPSGLSTTKDGAATFGVRWTLIEPYYRGKYPAACHLAPKKDLKKIQIQLADGSSLGAVVVK